MRRIQAVFFDLGDTVWHFPRRPSPAEVAAELAQRLAAVCSGWEAPPEHPAALQRSLAQAVGQAEAAADARGGVGPDYLGVVEETLRGAGIEPTPEQVAAAWQSQNAGGRFLGRELLPGALETLFTLRERGFRLGVITNRTHGGAGFMAELDDYGLGGVFETVVSSDQVGYRKPHVRIFEIGLQRLGVTSGESVHVGDRLEADVRGARGAGLTAVWMRGATLAVPERAPALDPAQAVIHHLAELLNLPFLSPTRA